MGTVEGAERMVVGVGPHSKSKGLRPMNWATASRDGLA